MRTETLRRMIKAADEAGALHSCMHIGSTAGGSPTLCNGPAEWAGIVRWSKGLLDVTYRCTRHKNDLEQGALPCGGEG